MYISFTASNTKEGGMVRVIIDGEVKAEYDVNVDRVVEFDTEFGHNILTIKDGKVNMTEADCKDQICVHTGVISHGKESIVCVPNRIIIEIVGENGGIDAISQ